MRIGIDLGGTKTEIICLNANNGKELYRKRVPSPQHDYAATIENMARLVREAEQELGQTGTVGVGIPGTVSKSTGLVKNANSVWLNSHPLDKDLGSALGRDVRVQNDANCLAVSEATDGAGAGKSVVFAIIVGTGCGAGIVVDGQPVSGLNGLGGEWGHNPLPLPRVYLPEGAPQSFWLESEGGSHLEQISPSYAHKALPEMFVKEPLLAEHPGPQCYCGKRGCVESWISGPAFKADHNRITGRDFSTHDIASYAEKGDALAKQALDRYFDRFARAVSTIINVLDPDIIVVGGGMSNIQSLYTEVPRIWDKYIFSTEAVETPIVPARFGDSSGVRGAAWLWGNG